MLYEKIKKMAATTLAIVGVVGVGMCIGETVTRASECDVISENSMQQTLLA